MFVGGIASGIDTEGLIQRLLAIERRPMVRMQEQKSLIGQQRDAWRDINTRLNHLRERAVELRSESLFHARTAVSGAEDVVGVAATRQAAQGRYEIEVEQLAAAHRVHSFKFEDPRAELGLSGAFVVNDVQIDVEATDSLTDIAAKLNDAEDAGVAATIIDGHLVVRATETGVDHEIRFGDPDGILAGDPGDENSGPIGGLGFLDGSGQLLTDHVLSEARDARFFVEGIAVERASNVVDDLLDGVTLTLRAEGRAEVEVAQNFDGVVSAVRAFVDQYNSTQTFIKNAQASNPEQGRKGLLAGDGLATRIQTQLRSGVTAPAGDGPWSTMMSIGVSVDRYGHMTLDEGKLRAALAEDPSAVHRLFGAEQEKDGFRGVAVRLEDTFQGWLETNTGLLAERQKMFGSRLRTIENSMERLEHRLELRERTLMRQFTALEEVLGGFQTQAMWLDGQLQQLHAMTAANPRR